MGKRLVQFAAFAAALVLAAFLGCGPKNACDGVKCPAGQFCYEKTGLCATGYYGDTGVNPLDGAVAGDSSLPGPDAGGSGLDAGASVDGSIEIDAGSGPCSPACSGSTPVCDPVSSTCKVCTDTHGCAAPYPVCDTSTLGGACVLCTATRGCSGNPLAPFCNTAVAGGWCVECTQDNHCTPRFCDLATHTCINVPPDAGAAPDAGTPSDDGGGAASDGGGIVCIHRGDAGVTACTSGCQEGFHCVGGVCVLNGGGGPVQVTLRWDQPEDLDLHVVEPLAAGGSCEIWYGDTNRPVGTSGCGAKGSLDLDSNAGCSIDNVDIENVIYPQGQPAPSGTYTVRVDYFAHCSATTPVAFEVTVRANGHTSGFCGSFGIGDADNGAAGSGVQITTFTVP